MQDERQEGLTTLTLWCRVPPVMPLKDITGDRSRRPQYLDKDLAKKLVQAVFPGCIEDELITDPPIEEYGRNDRIERLYLQYTGSEEHIRKADIQRFKVATDDFISLYRVTVEGTPSAIERAKNAISAYEVMLQIFQKGRAGETPEKVGISAQDVAPIV